MKRLLHIHIVTVLGIILLFTDCKKKKADDIPELDFTIAGNKYVHGFVSFKSNQPEGTDHSWELGDATTTYDVVPLHKYFVPGTYTVTLNVKGKKVSKPVIITLGRERIRQERTWIKYSGFADASGEHLIDSAEQTFTLDMPDDSTIVLPGDSKITLLKDPVNIFYSEYKSPAITYRNFNGTAKLTYYADKDSISIFRFQNVTSPVQGSYYTSYDTR